MHRQACPKCHRTPCRCGGGVLAEATSRVLHGSARILDSLSELGRDPAASCRGDILIHAVDGERRVVSYEVVNDSKCKITFEASVSPWTDCCSGDALASPSIAISAPGPIELEPGESHRFDLIVETGGFPRCGCYTATLDLGGTRCEPVRVTLCLTEKVPLVCRHDPSRLRAWLRQNCFEWEPKRYEAPAPELTADSC